MPEKFAMLYQRPTKPRLETVLQARTLAAVGVLGVAGVFGMHVLYSPAESVAGIDRPNHVSDAPEQVLRETSIPVALSTNSSPTATDGLVATKNLTSSGNSADTPVPSNGPQTSGHPPPEQGTDKAEKSAFLKRKVARRYRDVNRAYAQNTSQYSYSGTAVWSSQRSSPFRPF